MKALNKSNLAAVSGGVCHYDPATEQAISNAMNQLSAAGLIGSSVEKNIIDQIKATHFGWYATNENAR